ncbi:MAG: SPFH domain-containing protein [Planctomycetota bacterium]
MPENEPPPEIGNETPPTAPEANVEPAVVDDDPAQQSLADALRVSFLLLRVLMLALVVVYVFTGVYQVAEQEEAVVTRFGQIVTDAEGNQTKGRGLHFGFPFPVDRVIKVPTNERSLDLAQTFVYEGEGGTGPLNPERDGSLITGDANIVHARFTATYVIRDPVRYIANFGDPQEASRPVAGTRGGAGDPTGFADGRTGLEAAEQTVTALVEQGIVHAAATVSADDVIRGRFPTDTAVAVAQRQLDALGLGVDIATLNMRLPEMPLSVRDAYELVGQAEQQRNTQINEAETDRTRLLGEAAGKAALPVAGEDGPLVRLIKEYELATTLGQTDRLAELDVQLSEVFRNLQVPPAGDSDSGAGTPGGDIGGETATIINDAQIARSQIAQRIQTEAQTVLELRDAFVDDPELFRQRRWQRVLRGVFTDDSGIELIYAPSGQRLDLQMNRDPEIARTKERQRLENSMEENAAR